MRIVVSWAVAITLLGAEVAVAQSGRMPGREAMAQVSAVMAEKSQRSPAQRRMDSRLIFEMKRRRNDPLMARLPRLRSSVSVRSDQRTQIDLDGRITPALEQRVRELGGTIESSHPAWSTLRAWVPIMALESLASHADVRWLKPASRMVTNVVSQGDSAHAATLARSLFGADGSGVKICALSDGVDALESLQAQGELGPVAVIPGQRGTGSEGTALLEVIHDLAPAAALGFATANGGPGNFATNIDRLRASGCDVLVDDIVYPDEPVFQDGIIAQAVGRAVRAPMGRFPGAAYVSAAGNNGGVSRGTSSVFEDDFRGIPAQLDDGTLIQIGNFASDGSQMPFNTVDVIPTDGYVLSWSDPTNPGSSNDYDLFLFDQGMNNVIDMSIGVQDGTQPPVEIIGSLAPDDALANLAIVLFAGANRVVRLQTIAQGELRITKGGAIFGHAASEDAIAAGAAFVGTDPAAPFPLSAGIVDPFSSDGPRRIYYTPDGTPLTPGNFSTTGGRLVPKPDLVGASGVNTATPGFQFFEGTSAAAPHVAAIAGLVMSASLRAPNPGPLPVPFLARAALLPILRATAVKRDPNPSSFDEGAGVANALPAAQGAAAGLPCFDVIDNDGDGLADVMRDPGCATIASATEAPPCNDGVDNDDDGKVDLADGGCISPSDADECGSGAMQSMAVIPLLVYLGRRRSKRSRR